MFIKKLEYVYVRFIEDRDIVVLCNKSNVITSRYLNDFNKDYVIKPKEDAL